MIGPGLEWVPPSRRKLTPPVYIAYLAMLADWWEGKLKVSYEWLTADLPRRGDG